MMMDQKIFEMGLSVEATSVYLALCGLADEGRVLTEELVSGIWNTTEEALFSGLSELAARGVVRWEREGQKTIEILGSGSWT